MLLDVFLNALNLVLQGHRGEGEGGVGGGGGGGRGGRGRVAEWPGTID